MPTGCLWRNTVGGLVVVAFCTVQALADTIRFPDDDDNLSHAIATAAPGDTVSIAPGWYNTRGISLASGVTIRSESGNPSSVTLHRWASGRLFWADSVTDVVLEGLTIENGSVDEHDDGGALACYASSIELHDVVIQDSYAHERGGGMYCSDSEVQLHGVVFRNNRSRKSGGGLQCDNSDVVLSDCTFESNEVGSVQVTQTTESYVGIGAGMGCRGGSSVIAENVVFASNYTWHAGGGLSLHQEGTRAELLGCTFVDNATSTDVGTMGPEQQGAALWVSNAEVLLTDVQFSGNWSNHDGGAIYCSGNAPVMLDNCLIDECEAAHDGGGLYSHGEDIIVRDSAFSRNVAGGLGGAVYAVAWDGLTEFSYCTFSDNEAGSSGGAMSVVRGPVNVTNCTMFGNSAPSGSELLFGYSSFGAVSNSILSFGVDGAAVACVEGGLPEITHCYVFGHAPGDSLCGNFSGNMFVDPLMCSPSAGDFSLCGDSPCLVSNNAWGEPIGAIGEGCDPCNTPVLETSWGSIKAMYRGD